MDKKANRSAINNVLLDLLVAGLLCVGMYFVLIKLSVYVGPSEERAFLYLLVPLFIGGILFSVGLFLPYAPAGGFSLSGVIALLYSFILTGMIPIISIILPFMAMAGFICSGYWLVRQNRPNSIRRFAIGLGVWVTAISCGISIVSLLTGWSGDFWTKIIGIPLVVAASFVAGVMINIDFLANRFIASGSFLVALFLPPKVEKGLPNPYILLAIFIFVLIFALLMRPVLKKHIQCKITKK